MDFRTVRRKVKIEGADGKKSSVPKKEYSKNWLPGRKEAEVKLGS